jgi:hypothetical protein
VAEASLVARLLRWRLLTLDASVVLLPANAAPKDAGVMTLRRNAWRRRAATRGRLSDAMKNIDQAEQELARARNTSQSAAPQCTPRRTLAPPVRRQDSSEMLTGAAVPAPTDM